MQSNKQPDVGENVLICDIAHVKPWYFFTAGSPEGKFISASNKDGEEIFIRWFIVCSDCLFAAKGEVGKIAYKSHKEWKGNEVHFQNDPETN